MHQLSAWIRISPKLQTSSRPITDRPIGAELPLAGHIQ
jgi:hypothetical protein